MKVIIEPEGKEQETGEKVEVKLEERKFKSGSEGYYFRDRVKVGGLDYYVQIIISKK